jgi:hypothetical protein
VKTEMEFLELIINVKDVIMIFGYMRVRGIIGI